jgi:uncharacterized protein YjbI with pentapeptide repeats
LDFSRTLLVGVNFTGAMIGHTDFSYATLWGANLSDTDSLGANFTGAFLLGSAGHSIGRFRRAGN